MCVSNNPSCKKTSSITCGCGWVVRLKFVFPTKCRVSDSLEIIQVCGLHTNTCDPRFADQYVVTGTCSGEYKKCTDLVFQKITYQMSIDQEVSARIMSTLLKKVSPTRKSIKRHMINNVRLRALKTKNDLDDSNIEIKSFQFDQIFITEYNENTDNFFESK